MQELEVDAMAKQVEMENTIEDVKRERDALVEKSQQVGKSINLMRCQKNGSQNIIIHQLSF